MRLIQDGKGSDAAAGVAHGIDDVEKGGNQGAPFSVRARKYKMGRQDGTADEQNRNQGVSRKEGRARRKEEVVVVEQRLVGADSSTSLDGLVCAFHSCLCVCLCLRLCVCVCVCV